VPVPKKGICKEDLNDFRPVALTPHLMKTLERIVLPYLRSMVGSMDPLQFVYRSHVGVEDVIIYLLGLIHTWTRLGAY